MLDTADIIGKPSKQGSLDTHVEQEKGAFAVEEEEDLELDGSTNDSKVLEHSYLEQTIGYDKNSLNSYCECDFKTKNPYYLRNHQRDKHAGPKP